ncbi:acylphosphatase [Gracilibacillus massiliensis]|uniref:acylphosphatase n=1 Tax=Gracilibacillus massiliensis TaxID=1564956 RepID=UPI00071E3980|nr:acylphosphatase [Gracilibacillus massiliensis]
MRRIHLVVSGRVQGVGFRSFTQQAAVENDIVGWVRNLNDGAVEVDAVGEDKKVDHFIKKVKKGPSFFAKVKNIEVTECEEDHDYQKFEIVY